MPQSQPPRRCPCTAPTQPPRRLLGRSRPQLSHTRPHSSYRQRRGTSWGLQEQVKQQNDGRRGSTSTSRAPAEPPPLATFWTPTHPHTGLQAPPEPPATEGSEQARGGRDWGRCWCIFAHVAAAATRARTHGSLWHIFSTVLAISEVLKPLRAPLARGFFAFGGAYGSRTPTPSTRAWSPPPGVAGALLRKPSPTSAGGRGAQSSSIAAASSIESAHHKCRWLSFLAAPLSLLLLPAQVTSWTTLNRGEAT